MVPPSPDRPVKGVVHFLGGAFAGAAPQVKMPDFNFALTYSTVHYYAHISRSEILKIKWRGNNQIL